MVLYGSGIFQFRLFGYANELLDVVPLAAKESGIVRYGVISAVYRGDARDHRKLAAASALCKFALQILPRCGDVEQVDFLNISASGYLLSPVGVKDFGNTTVFISRGEATIAGFLSQQPDDARAVLVENKH